MSRATVSLNAVVGSLREERLLSVDADTVDQALGRMAALQPWYIRTMVGFGAWLASLMLIGFVAGLGFTFEWGFALFGLGFVIAAVFLRRSSEGDFAVQCSLATALAGQALIVFGFARASGWHEPESIYGLILLLNVLLFFIFPDRIHRVISVLLCVAAMALLFYAWGWNAAVPVLGPVVAAVLVMVHHYRGPLVAAGHGAFLRPLQSGLMLGAFGCLMLSTIYIVPEINLSFEFYPRPWVSTLLLGTLLLLVAPVMLKKLLVDAPRGAVMALYFFLGLIIACALQAPGILLALIIILLGSADGNRTMTGAGIGFLVIFLGAYFYGIEITMLHKSMTLAATGVAILLGRWTLLKLLHRGTSG